MKSTTKVKRRTTWIGNLVAGDCVSITNGTRTLSGQVKKVHRERVVVEDGDGNIMDFSIWTGCELPIANLPCRYRLCPTIPKGAKK